MNSDLANPQPYACHGFPIRRLAAALHEEKFVARSSPCVLGKRTHVSSRRTQSGQLPHPTTKYTSICMPGKPPNPRLKLTGARTAHHERALVGARSLSAGRYTARMTRDTSLITIAFAFAALLVGCVTGGAGHPLIVRGMDPEKQNLQEAARILREWPDPFDPARVAFADNLTPIASFRQGATSEAEIDAVAKLLTDPNAAVRVRAASALGALGPRASRALPDLNRALQARGARSRELVVGEVSEEASLALAISKIAQSDADRSHALSD